MQGHLTREGSTDGFLLPGGILPWKVVQMKPASQEPLTGQGGRDGILLPGGILPGRQYGWIPT